MKKQSLSTLVLSLCILFVTPSFAAKTKKSRFEKIELFNKVLYLVESQYYREVDTEKLIQGAIKGMMDTLDPHSNFLDKKVFARMQEETKGEFGGLGIEVTIKDGVIIVITPIEDSPAFKAGIKAGDRILEIDHESIAGNTLEQSVEKMRGDIGSKISIGVIREGVEGIKNFDFKRQVIKVKPIKSSMIKDNYAYIRLIQFQERSASSIVKAIKKLRKQSKKKGGLKGIILDLRSNPGGLLDEAVNVSSIFLKKGIVVSTEGRDPKNKDIRYVRKTGHKELDIPLLVLINGASASASEIVAGALQDHGRAIIAGKQSFGKGSVQTVASIDKEKGVKLTIAQYMTSKGRKIQAVGIKPDIEIEAYDFNVLKDNELQSSFVREADLKNHLTATIETKNEKDIRIAEEKIARKLRIKKYNRIRDAKKNKLDKKIQELAPKVVKPENDYQVLEAIKYLQSFALFKKFNKTK